MSTPNYPRSAHETAPEPEKCDRTITFKLPARLDARIRARATEKRRTVSKWLNLLVEDFFAMDDLERRDEAIEAGRR